MLLLPEYRAGLLDRLASLIEADPGAFQRYSAVFSPQNLDSMWAIYQKSIQDYGLDPDAAAKNAVQEVLGIPASTFPADSARFAVVFDYAADGETAVYLFSEENAAKQFLRDNYEEYFRATKEERSARVSGEISENGLYAVVSVLSQDAEETVEMRIGQIYS